MPKTFTITTTATDTLKTDAKGHAEAAFTVTNTGQRPMRGIAKAVALDSTKSEWLKVTGETEREFPPGGTQQVVVTFDSPPTAAPAGTRAPATGSDKFGFRLDVASATNPDEDSTEGPVVKVAPTEPPPLPGPKKPFPKWIFIPIGVVVLAIIGVVLWWLLSGDKAPKGYVIPDVANAPESEARQKLETGCQEKTGCAVVEVSAVPDNTVAKGNALGTEPVAGTEVPVGSKVVLAISGGPEATPVVLYKLPAVVNVAEANAKRALETGCGKPEPCVQVEVSRIADSKVPSGIAIRTDPETGTELNVGDKVTMFVSKGPDKVTIQNVANLNAEAAMDRLEKSCEPAPCFEVEVNRIADNKVPPGLVIRTQPGPGTVVNAGFKVLLFVSGGTDEVTIPQVRNIPLAQARQLLANACKQKVPCIEFTQNNLNDPAIEAGRAISTTPRTGAAVKMGSTIVLNVSTGPELRTVGKYTGLTEVAARAKIVTDGFRVGTVSKVPNFMVVSLVISQTPTAGVRRPKGSLINLRVMSR